MDQRNVLILGGTGLVGEYLTQALTRHGYKVKIVSRSKKEGHCFWNPETQEYSEQILNNLDIVINLCGAGIAEKRWTKSRREVLIKSRTEPAAFFYKICKTHNKFPKQYISASGIAAYGYSEGIKTETDEFGNDFLSKVVKHWEKSASLFESESITTILRIGFVLTPKNGGLSQISNPIKKGFGTLLGKGDQPLSWIHYQDLIAIIEFCIEYKTSGIFNTCSPNTTTNKKITTAIANSLEKRLLPIKAPSFALKLILGKMSEMILKGQNASSQKLINKGFTFQFPDIGTAINELNLKGNKSKNTV